MAAKVDPNKCTGCGTCEDVCPVECIKVNDVAVINESECSECGTCVDECPQEAIELAD